MRKRTRRIGGLFCASVLALAAIASAVDRVAGDARLDEVEKKLAARDREGADAILLPLLKELEAATAKPDATADDWYLLGRVRYVMNADQQAMAALDKAIELKPDDAQSYFLRATLKHYAKDAAGALADVRKAAELDPKKEDYLAALASGLQQANQIDEAKAVCLKWAEAVPASSAPYSTLCSIAMQANDVAAALDYARQGVARSPDGRIPLSNLGQALQANEKYDEAIVVYEKLRTAAPNDWRAAAKLVQLHHAKGDAAKRDAVREELLAMHNAGKVDQKQFCREQSTLPDGRRLMVFEVFDIGDAEKGDLHRYTAVALDAKTGETVARVTLESLFATTTMSREMGKIKADQRMWTVDAYPPGGHETWGMYAEEPTYEAFHAQALLAMSGTKKPISSSGQTR